MSVLVPADRELLATTAERIVRARMAVPAMMMLEMVQPMNFVSASMLRVVSPTWRLVVGSSRIEQVAKILDDRKAIPEFIEMIDRCEDDHRRQRRDAREAAKSAASAPNEPAPPQARTRP